MTTTGLRAIRPAPKLVPDPLPRQMQACLARSIYKTTARRLSLNAREARILSG